MEFRGATKVIKGVQIVGAVFCDEFDVIVAARQSEEFNNIRPSGMNVCAQGWFPGIEQLAQLVGSDGEPLLGSRLDCQKGAFLRGQKFETYWRRGFADISCRRQIPISADAEDGDRVGILAT